MTAENKLNALLDYIRMEVNTYQELMCEDHEREQKALEDHDYARSTIYSYDAARHSSLVGFGTDLLEYVEILEREYALQQMRIASAANKAQ